MTKRSIVLALAASILVSGIALAQTSNATLGGTVTDASGALIPGVSITATNTQTGIVTTVISNESGTYQFASLQTGTYKVSAELAGFQTQTYNQVALGISQQVRLNFTLQVGGVAQSVEVTVAADTLLATTSSSIGSVVPEYKIRDLPLGGRNVMDLVSITAGAGPVDNTQTAAQGYFAGGRSAAVAVTRDGFNISDGRYDLGAFAALYTSPDLVEEVRVITAPVDADGSRGSGQVQMATRSGTNQYRGSLFWNNRNSVLDSSNWFNNFNGVKKDWENRNQFGGRLGGPIIKNKTFFFVLIDEQRDLVKQTFVGSVLTAQARQGIFRFFPGADNGNALSNSPVVDRNGNPVRPAAATGDLQSYSVFNRDPFRPGYDPSGFVQNTLLSRMPMPNDYTIGDGLNTAGIRFTRRIRGQELASSQGVDVNRDQFNMRLDHNFNSKHKLSFLYTYERNIDDTTQAGVPTWPDGFSGENDRWPNLYAVSLVSTLSSSLVNELRISKRTTKTSSWAPWYVGRDGDSEGEPGAKGKEALKLLPVNNGVPFQPATTLFPNNFLNYGTTSGGTTRGSISPLTSYGDTLSWSEGKHAFKFGGEFRQSSSNGWNDSNMTPQAVFGAGGKAVTGIDNVSMPGLIGNNQTTARNLLIDLSGSVNNILEGFDIRNPRDLVFKGYADGVKLKKRWWENNEFSGFFKDSWKVSSALTLNFGVHYDFYSVPYEHYGLAAQPTGGGFAGLCGVSCGGITTVEFIGKNSPQPDKKFYNNDWNNYAPSFGLSWSIPWFGKDKTVLRAGYGWSYTGLPVNGMAVQSVPGTFAGSSAGGTSYTTADYLSMSNLKLPVPHGFIPLQAPPLTGSRSDDLAVYDTNRLTPYVQNFNFSLQRQISRNLMLDIGYVGTKGTRLFGGIPLNNVKIFGNGVLEAFNTTRAGGNAKLFDDMLAGLNLGSGVINGTTVTGSASLRSNTNTRSFIANGNVGGLADFLNRSTNVTGEGGGFVRNSGLFPENFIVLNPQFNGVTLNSNPGNSTYHSLQMELTKRLSHGVTNSTTYTWSRALGENDGNGSVDYRDPRNRRLDKSLLGFHRTHTITSTGTFELPFGPNRAFLSNASGFVKRLVERWQWGGVFNWSSGAPLTITAPISTLTQATANSTPVIVGDFPKSMGKVTKVSNGVVYFDGLQQIPDPSRSGVTALQSTQGSFTNRAIADSQGRLLLVNPTPGEIGNMGLSWIEGPSRLLLDMNLIKRVRLSENREFELRIDAVNVLNHPNFGSPNLNINNLSFGRITSATGNRRFVTSLRLNF